jgi:hypothetical protein
MLTIAVLEVGEVRESARAGSGRRSDGRADAEGRVTVDPQVLERESVGPRSERRAQGRTSCSPPEPSGIEIRTAACGMSTFTRPVGVRMKDLAPEIVNTPAALMVSAVSGSISPAALKPARIPRSSRRC